MIRRSEPFTDVQVTKYSENRLCRLSTGTNVFLSVEQNKRARREARRLIWAEPDFHVKGFSRQQKIRQPQRFSFTLTISAFRAEFQVLLNGFPIIFWVESASFDYI